MSRLRSVLTLVTGTALLQSCGLETPWMRSVDNQLNEIVEIAQGNDYRLMEERRSGSLDRSEEETLSLKLSPGIEYMVVGVCDQDCSDIDLRLYDSSGNEVDVDVEPDDTPLVSVIPESADTYRLQVIMIECSTEPCYYGVGVMGRESAAGALASAGEPTERLQGELRKGDETLESGEYVDRHPFSARAGQSIVVDLTSTDFDPYLILMSPGGEQTENDDYDGSVSHSRVAIRADESGSWTVLVTSYEPGESGSYRMTRTVSDEEHVAGSGERFESGMLSDGDETLESGEYADPYTLVGTRGDQVVIDLRSRDFDPYLILTAPSGEQEENDDYEGDAGRSLLSLSLAESGEYTVVVTSYAPGSTGSYDLFIDQRPGGEINAAARTERGILSEGDATLQSGEYTDRFELTGRPGQRVHLDLTSDEFDTYLILKTPDGEQTENDDHDRHGHSVIDADITEYGEYQVLVTSFAEGETGAYELIIDLTDAPVASDDSRDVVTLGLGESVSGVLGEGDGRLEGGEYRDLYVFDGTQGESITIEMGSADFDTYLGLMAPGGEDEQNDDYEGSTSRSRIETTLRDSGRYRIIATSYKAGETGSYDLTLRRTRPPSRRAEPQPESAEQGRVYGVFVGVSDYGRRARPLPYTAEDASRLQQAMIRGAGMRSEDAVLLQDGGATVEKLRSAVQEVSARVGPEDTFVLFFSGHGDRLSRGGPQPSDPDALDETLELYDAPIRDDELRDLLSETAAGTVLVFLDACFSGGFSKDVISVPGRMGLFSSEEDVTSSVASKFRAGGYLSAFLADAIGDHLADSDGNGQITAFELSQYVHERYRRDVKGGGPDDYVRTGGPQLGYQHLVVDRGSIGARQVLFR